MDALCAVVFSVFLSFSLLTIIIFILEKSFHHTNQSRISVALNKRYFFIPIRIAKRNAHAHTHMCMCNQNAEKNITHNMTIIQIKMCGKQNRDRHFEEARHFVVERDELPGKNGIHTHKAE